MHHSEAGGSGTNHGSEALASSGDAAGGAGQSQGHESQLETNSRLAGQLQQLLSTLRNTNQEIGQANAEIMNALRWHLQDGEAVAQSTGPVDAATNKLPSSKAARIVEEVLVGGGDVAGGRATGDGKGGSYITMDEGSLETVVKGETAREVGSTGEDAPLPETRSALATPRGGPDEEAAPAHASGATCSQSVTACADLGSGDCAVNDSPTVSPQVFDPVIRPCSPGESDHHMGVDLSSPKRSNLRRPPDSLSPRLAQLQARAASVSSQAPAQTQQQPVPPQQRSAQPHPKVVQSQQRAAQPHPKPGPSRQISCQARPELGLCPSRQSSVQPHAKVGPSRQPSAQQHPAFGVSMAAPMETATRLSPASSDRFTRLTSPPKLRAKSPGRLRSGSPGRLAQTAYPVQRFVSACAATGSRSVPAPAHVVAQPMHPAAAPYAMSVPSADGAESPLNLGIPRQRSTGVGLSSSMLMYTSGALLSTSQSAQQAMVRTSSPIDGRPELALAQSVAGVCGAGPTHMAALGSATPRGSCGMLSLVQQPVLRSSSPTDGRDVALVHALGSPRSDGASLGAATGVAVALASCGVVPSAQQPIMRSPSPLDGGEQLAPTQAVLSARSVVSSGGAVAEAPVGPLGIFGTCGPCGAASSGAVVRSCSGDRSSLAARASQMHAAPAYPAVRPSSVGFAAQRLSRAALAGVTPTPAVASSSRSIGLTGFVSPGAAAGFESTIQTIDGMGSLNSLHSARSISARTRGQSPSSAGSAAIGSAVGHGAPIIPSGAPWRFGATANGSMEACAAVEGHTLPPHAQSFVAVASRQVSAAAPATCSAAACAPRSVGVAAIVAARAATAAANAAAHAGDGVGHLASAPSPSGSFNSGPVGSFGRLQSAASPASRGSSFVGTAPRQQASPGSRGASLAGTTPRQQGSQPAYVGAPSSMRQRRGGGHGQEACANSKDVLHWIMKNSKDKKLSL